MKDRVAREHWWRVGAVFLVVLAARWWLISTAGSPVPFWDQWYSDVHDVRAVADGNFWRGIFDAHNEHRIVFTRLLNRTLLWIGGQWDPLAQMFAAAVIHAAAAALLAGWLSARLARTSAGLLAITVAALYALPHAWQNTLWGFQSQFSFLLLFSFSCLAWLGRAHGPREWRWWLGFAAGIAANLAMAAGAVTGATLVAVAVWEFARRRAWHAEAGWRLLAGLALVAFAWSLHVPVPAHGELQVTGTSQFAAVLISALAWPNQNLPLLFGLANAPLLLVVVRTLTRPGEVEPVHRTMLLAGAWSALQAVAFAYARGGAAVRVFEAASRYHDVLAVLAAANALGVAWWVCESTTSAASRRWMTTLAATTWGALLVFGLVATTAHVLRTEIATRRRDPGLDVRVVIALQRGMNPEQIYAQLPPGFRVWQPSDAIRRVQDDATLVAWLPPEIAPAATIPGAAAPAPRELHPLTPITRSWQRHSSWFATATAVTGLLLLVAALPESLYGAIRSTSRNRSASGAQPRSGNT